MTIGPSFEIDQAAKKLFRAWLPDNWLVREEDPDVHIDYVIELVDDGEPSGLKFGVQLKGAREIGGRRAFVSKSLPSKHIAYFVDKSAEPVFLVYVDVTAKQGYWVDVREWARDNHRWRTQKSAAIRLPRSASLEKIADFEAAVRKAIEKGRSIESAALRLKRRYEAMDPRVDATASYIDGSSRVDLRLRNGEGKAFGFRVTAAPEKLRELLDVGGPVSFDIGDLCFEGNPILESVAQGATGKELTLEIAGRRECEVELFDSGSDGQVSELLFATEAIARITGAGVRIDLELKRSPLAISLSVPRDGTGAGEMGLSFDYSAWIGQDLLLAAHFERVRKILEAIAGRRLELRCGDLGNPLFRAKPTIAGSTLREMSAVVGLLRDARLVATHLGVSPCVPTIERLASAQEQIVELLAIVKAGSVRVDCPDLTGCAEFRFSQEFPGEFAPADNATLRMSEPIEEFLDAVPSGWYVHRQFSDLSVPSDSSREVRAARVAGLPAAQVRFLGNARSHYVATLARGDLGSPSDQA